MACRTAQETIINHAVIVTRFSLLRMLDLVTGEEIPNLLLRIDVGVERTRDVHPRNTVRVVELLIGARTRRNVIPRRDYWANGLIYQFSDASHHQCFHQTPYPYLDKAHLFAYGVELNFLLNTN
jgi:hypothetical protein